MDDALGHINLALAGMPGLDILAAFHARRSSADRLVITLEFAKQLPAPMLSAKTASQAKNEGRRKGATSGRRKSPCQQRRAARRGAAGTAANAGKSVPVD